MRANVVMPFRFTSRTSISCAARQHYFKLLCHLDQSTLRCSSISLVFTLKNIFMTTWRTLFCQIFHLYFCCLLLMVLFAKYSINIYITRYTYANYCETLLYWLPECLQNNTLPRILPICERIKKPIGKMPRISANSFIFACITIFMLLMLHQNNMIKVRLDLAQDDMARG